MAKYEVAQGGDLHLTIEAKDDVEFFDKANSWETIIKEKLAEIGIEFKFQMEAQKLSQKASFIASLQRRK